MKTRHSAINWLFAALGRLVNPNSCDVVVLNGKLDRGRLGAAIAATLARHPILCRPLNPRRTVAGPLPIDLRYHDLLEQDAAYIDEYLLRLIWEEPLADTGRPIRFHVVETRERTYFQTIHTHVYADATACYAVTAQIAAAYAGLPMPAVEDDFAVADAIELLSQPVPWRGQLGSRMRGIAQTASDFAMPFSGLATPQRSAAGRRRLARLVLDAADTRRLREAARARGHSIHAFFQLAFLRAATAFNQRCGVQRSRLRLWDFFSLRPRLGKAAGRYDCLALIYPVDLDARWSDALVLSRCTNYVEKMRKEDLAMHAQRLELGARAFALSPRAFLSMWPAIFKSNVFITNPGVCPSPLLTFGELEVVDYVTFPQLFFPADVMFVFSTFRDRLRILTTYDQDAFAGGGENSFHRQLLAPFLAYLGKLADLNLGVVETRDGFVASWNEAPARLVAPPAPGLVQAR